MQVVAGKLFELVVYLIASPAFFSRNGGMWAMEMGVGEENLF
jgi:hypothetical protein